MTDSPIELPTVSCKPATGAPSLLVIFSSRIHTAFAIPVSGITRPTRQRNAQCLTVRHTDYVTYLAFALAPIGVVRPDVVFVNAALSQNDLDKARVDNTLV